MAIFGIRRESKQPQPAKAANSASGAPAGSGQFLVPDKHRAPRRVNSPLRIIGNLLIAVGLLLLLGIGGWYGFMQWNNQQDIQRLEQNFGPQSFEPPVDATPVPTQRAVPTPLPDLSGGLTGLVSQPPKAPDNSPPTRLVIPSVAIDAKVVTVTWQMVPSPEGGMKSEWQVADYAVGHNLGSANPGQVGNVVLSGHVDYKGQVFKDLNKVKKGDEVVIYTGKGQYLYVVTDMVIVKEDGASDAEKRRNARYMDPTPDPTLTMITCWPYGIDTHRLVVIAKPYQSALSTLSEYQVR